MNLYLWLKFLHIAGLAVFLLAHGVSGGAALALRGQLSADSRRLLRLSQVSSFVANPGLLLVIVTGVWMAFAGSFWGRGWVWATVVVLVAVVAVMGYVARPYYMARDAAAGPDDVLAERLGRTQPMLAVSVGLAGLLVLLALMVFKPF